MWFLDISKTVPVVACVAGVPVGKGKGKDERVKRDKIGRERISRAHLDFPPYGVLRFLPVTNNVSCIFFRC